MPDPLDTLLRVRGLSDKVNVIRQYSDELVSNNTLERANLIIHSENNYVMPEFDYALLKYCIERGIGPGAIKFFTDLVFSWVEIKSEEAKVPFLKYWSDPLLRISTVDFLKKVILQERKKTDRDRIQSHIQFLENWHKESGKSFFPIAAPLSSMSDIERFPDIGTCLNEFYDLRQRGAEYTERRIEVAEFLIEVVLSSDNQSIEEQRSTIALQLASDYIFIYSKQLESDYMQGIIRKNIETMFGVAVNFFEKNKLSEGHLEFLAQVMNFNLIRSQLNEFKLVDVAFGVAERLVNLSMQARVERGVAVGLVGKVTAMRVKRELVAQNGESQAELIERALQIFKRIEDTRGLVSALVTKLEILVDDALAGDQSVLNEANQAVMSALKIVVGAEFDATYEELKVSRAKLHYAEYLFGSASSAAKAHSILDEVIQARQEAGQTTRLGVPLLNKALVLASQYKNGEQWAAEMAHRCYDSAYAIFCEADRMIDAARVLVNKANLLTEQYWNADLSKQSVALGAFEEAIVIFEHYNCSGDLQAAYQDKAILLLSMFKSGDHGANLRAHEAYNKANNLFLNSGDGPQKTKLLMNRGNLYLAECEAGDASAGDKARQFYLDALNHALPGTPLSQHLSMRRNLLLLAEAQREHAETLEIAEEIIRLARGGIANLPDRASRHQLLSEIEGIGRQGAYAALQLEEVDRALAILEGGRAQQLNDLLAQAEAGISPEELSKLDGLRRSCLKFEQFVFDAAERLSILQAIKTNKISPEPELDINNEIEKVRNHLARAESELRVSHDKLQSAKSQFGLADFTLKPATNAALRLAIDGSTLFVPVHGIDGGFLLELRSKSDGWKVHWLPNLNNKAVEATWAAHLAAIDSLSTAYRNGRTDAQREASELLATLSGGKNERPGGVPGLWDLIMGSIHRIAAASDPVPAEGSDIAHEVVLCPTPELAILPLSCARSAGDRRFFEDFALRLTPSLTACISSSRRARRSIPNTAVTVIDPLDDLNWERVQSEWISSKVETRHLTGYRGDPRNENVATWKSVKKLAEDMRPGWFIYFGHSSWDKQNAENSGIFLAKELDYQGNIPKIARVDASTTAADTVHARQIRELAFDRTRLVIQGSCSGGGIGLMNARDEFVGLVTAYLEAGAAGVIATLWPVITTPTAKLISRLTHYIIEEGVEPAQALRRAQIDLAGALESTPHSAGIKNNRKKGFDEFSRFHPEAHVAAFVLFGQ